MQCVVLAGGLATRMLPATGSVPKVLLPIAGKPFAAHQLALLRRNGVDEVVFCIGHLGVQVRDFVGDGERFGLKVRYIDEGDHLRGTGGALKLAAEADALHDRFFVIYGDSYLLTDLRAVDRAFVTSGAEALMTVFRNEDQRIASNATFHGNRVTRYDKRWTARCAKMRWIDYGISVLTCELVEAEVPPNSFVDLADVFRRLSLAGRLAGLEVVDRFFEIGSPEGVREAEEFLREAGPGRPASD